MIGQSYMSRRHLTILRTQACIFIHALFRLLSRRPISVRIVHVVLFERPPKSADLPLLTCLLLQLFTWVIPTGDIVQFSHLVIIPRNLMKFLLPKLSREVYIGIPMPLDIAKSLDIRYQFFCLYIYLSRTRNKQPATHSRSVLETQSPPIYIRITS